MNSLRHLELIAALGTHRHFGKAAESLGISQPALTKGLLHIETTLGVRLFERTGSIVPAVFGEIVLAHGVPIIEAFEELLREVHLTKSLDTGHLSVSAGLFPAEISGQEAFGVLSHSHPSISCTLNVKDWVSVVEDVLSAKADLGFADITEAQKNPALEVELVRKSPLRVICRAGHPLTLFPQIAMPDLFEFPWVGVNLPPAVLQIVPAAPKPFGSFDKRAGVVWPRIRVETFAAINRIVVSGDALSVAPDVLIGDDVQSGRLAVLPIDIPWLGLNYGFIKRSGRSLTPSARAFMSTVRSIEAKASERMKNSPAA